jgi:hypothetical protein
MPHAFCGVQFTLFDRHASAGLAASDGCRFVGFGEPAPETVAGLGSAVGFAWFVSSPPPYHVENSGLSMR